MIAPHKRAGSAEPATIVAPSGPVGPSGFLFVVLVLVIVWAGLFSPQLFAGRVFVAGDWPQYAPFAEFSAQRWQEQRVRTFWNPYVFLGLPTAASLADSRPQYLPDALLDAIGALDHLPVWPPLILPLVAHLVGMLAAAWLARLLWGVGAWAMAWAGVAWGALPNLVVPFAYGHHAQLVTAGLMPLALLLVHQLFAIAELRPVALAALGLAVTIGVQTIAGHPQFVYYALVLTGAFAIERALHFHRRARLVLGLGAVLLGFAMSAASWWPMVLYGMDSVRGGVGGVWLTEVSRYSLAFRDLAAFAWPGAMGFHDPSYWGGMGGTDYPQYVGLVVLVLAGLVAVRPKRDRATLLFTGAAGIAVLLSLGTHLGRTYELLRAALPLFSRLRVAVAVLIVMQLAFALLSARGLERALQGPPAATRRVLVVATIAVVLTVVALAIAPGPFELAYARVALATREGLDASIMRGVARAARADLAVHLAVAAGALALLAFAAPGRRARVAGPLLVALLAVDLVGVTRPHLQAATGKRELLRAPPQLLLSRLAAAEPRSRCYSDWLEEIQRSNDWVSWRTPFVGGAHGTPPRLWGDLIGSALVRHPAIQRALAVSYLSSLPNDSLKAADYERVSPAAANPVLWRLRDSLPRAYAVPRVEVVGNDVAVARAMAKGGSFPRQVAYASDERAAGSYPGSLDCAIRWLEDTPDRLVLEADAREPAFMVIADAWFAGWRALVDDTEIPIFRVNYLIRGVPLPAGRHRLEMRYLPPGWRPGVVLTRVAALAWFVLLLAALLWRQARGHAAERATDSQRRG